MWGKIIDIIKCVPLKIVDLPLILLGAILMLFGKRTIRVTRQPPIQNNLILCI